MTLDGTVFEAENLKQLDGIRHGFFTREGGVSSGLYSALNVGLGSDDKPDDVLENRRRVAGHLSASHDGRPLTDIMTTYQVHSAKALIIDAPLLGERPRADALVTKMPGLAVGALAADCTPVLFADPVGRVVAAAHAGWRGAVTGILQSTIDAMVKIGAERSNIRVAVGPTIHQPSYEVGPDFQAHFIDQAPGNESFFSVPPGKSKAHFDLPGYCRKCLRDAGIRQVSDLGLCTYTNESLFFSYRRKTHRNEPDYGRQISAIVVA